MGTFGATVPGGVSRRHINFTDPRTCVIHESDPLGSRRSSSVGAGEVPDLETFSSSTRTSSTGGGYSTEDTETGPCGVPRPLGARLSHCVSSDSTEDVLRRGPGREGDQKTWDVTQVLIQLLI